jgi:NAD(P)-dependent dehydrogenase (short-subunit alcohol dehydrogenase family)
MTHWASEFFSGRVVLVAGGTSGIGLGIATEFAAAGARVIATGATEAEVAKARVLAIPGVAYEVLDVRSDDAVKALAAEQEQLVALVDCAGINLRAEEFTLEGFATVLDINLTGAMRLAMAFRPLLKGGAILNLGSMFSFFGSGYAPGYAASKGGVAQLTKSLAIAFAPDNIRVNALAPGWIETPMTAVPRANPARYAELEARTPMGRWGRPEDLTGPALFLCSPLAGFITGTVLPVDGGYLVS